MWDFIMELVGIYAHPRTNLETGRKRGVSWRPAKIKMSGPFGTYSQLTRKTTRSEIPCTTNICSTRITMAGSRFSLGFQEVRSVKASGSWSLPVLIPFTWWMSRTMIGKGDIWMGLSTFIHPWKNCRNGKSSRFQIDDFWEGVPQAISIKYFIGVHYL